MYNIYNTNAMKSYNNDDFYNPHLKDHGIRNKHMLCVGMTGSGKSNFASNLIVQMSSTWRKVIIVCNIVFI